MQTFTAAKPFLPHPFFSIDHEDALWNLDPEIHDGSIDPPLVPLIRN